MYLLYIYLKLGTRRHFWPLQLATNKVVNYFITGNLYETPCALLFTNSSRQSRNSKVVPQVRKFWQEMVNANFFLVLILLCQRSTDNLNPCNFIVY